MMSYSEYLDNLERNAKFDLGNERLDKCDCCNHVLPYSMLKSYSDFDYRACDRCRLTEACKTDMKNVYILSGEEVKIQLIETFLND